jgi:hypothetical protein
VKRSKRNWGNDKLKEVEKLGIKEYESKVDLSIRRSKIGHFNIT